MTVVALAAIVALSALASPATAVVSLSGSGGGGSASPGGTVEVTFTVTNDGDEDASTAVVDVAGLPDGWAVVEDGGDGTLRGSSREILFFPGPGAGEESVSHTLTLSVPGDAANGSYTVSADVKNAQNTVVDSFDVTVTVSDSGAEESGRRIELDGDVTSGETFLQGQKVFFDDSVAVDGTSRRDRTFQLRRVNDNDVGDLIREIVVRKDGTKRIETSDLDVFVFITYKHDIVVVGEGGEVTAVLDQPNSTDVKRAEWGSRSRRSPRSSTGTIPPSGRAGPRRWNSTPTATRTF